MMGPPITAEGPSDFKKQQDMIRKKITSAASKTDSKILAKQAKKENRNRPEIQHHAEMAERLFHEGVDMFRDGEFTFQEFADDLHRSLSALGRAKSRDQSGGEEHMVK